METLVERLNKVLNAEDVIIDEALNVFTSKIEKTAYSASVEPNTIWYVNSFTPMSMK